MTAVENPIDPAVVASAVPASASAARSGRGMERQYHLDALRSILMILGVFLHGSYLYAAGKSWVVKDDDSSRLLLWINQSIHFFRIPCFFILSGFFAQMLIERQGRIPFVKMRIKRLALPLASTALLFNTLQAYLLHGSRTGSWNPGAFTASGGYAGFWTSGEWIGHLWFLVYVLVFSVVAAGFWAAWKRNGRAHSTGDRPGRTDHGSGNFLSGSASLFRAAGSGGRFLFLLPIAHVAFFAAAGFLPFLYWNWGGLSLYGLLTYSPYYAFGLVVFLSPRVREEFHRIRPWQAIAIPAALGLELWLGARFSADWARAALRYLDAYLVWSCCILLFALFRLLLNRRTRIFTYLSEASYSIYLFHHACVVGLGLWLAGMDWNVLAKFGVVVSVSMAVSTALHHFLVLRIRVLRLLFMGK